MFYSNKLIPLIAILGSTVCISGCSWMTRVTNLEQRVDQTSEQVTKLETNNQEINTLKNKSEQIAVLQNENHRLKNEFDELKQSLSGRSHLSVTVSSNEWQTIYGNSSGISQIVILTRPEGSQIGKLDVRISTVAKKNKPSTINPSERGLTGISTNNNSSEFTEAWDLSPGGSQRRQRIGCGYEIQARTTGVKSRVYVLVQPDPSPLTCDH